MKVIFPLFLCYLICVSITVQCNHQPNIVIFVADDLGRRDVGAYGLGQIKTPNLDAIGMNGKILDKFYTLPSCTPTRASLLTGQYAMRTGLQGIPIFAGQPRFLPTSFPTIAEKLKDIGYATHAVGKWHLGFKFRNVMPTMRGFDSHFGIWNGFSGYFDYEVQDIPLGYNGFDLHNNFEPAYEYANQIFATDLYRDKANDIITNHDQHNPLFLLINHQAPNVGKMGLMETKDPIAAQLKYSHIVDPVRRIYADLLNDLDTSIGKTVKALQDVGMLNNTILIVMSDNGAQTDGILANHGSNWPLRGQRLSVTEGGVRSFAAIWSPQIFNKKNPEFNLVHVTDILPTLYNAAGGNPTNLGILDGIDQWPLLTTGVAVNTRANLLINYDNNSPVGAVMTGNGRYKLIQGSFAGGIYDLHVGDPGLLGPAYDVNAVLNSDANLAISAASNFVAPLTASDILTIKSKLTVKDNYGLKLPLSCTTTLDGYCLFDLDSDPLELNDIKLSQGTIYNNLKQALTNYKSQAAVQGSLLVEPESNPSHCNNTWFNWGESDPALKCANYQ